MSHDHFTAFLQDIRTQVWKMQFRMFDQDGDGWLSAYTFATHIAAHAKTNQNTLIRRAMELETKNDHLTTESNTDSKRMASLPVVERLKGSRFDWENFRAFHGMVDSVETLSRAVTLLHAGGEVCTKSELQRIIRVTTGQEFSDEQAELIFFLFDEDQNGLLDHSEFLSVLSEAASNGLNKPRDLGISRFIKCVSNCRKKRKSSNE